MPFVVKEGAEAPKASTSGPAVVRRLPMASMNFALPLGRITGAALPFASIGSVTGPRVESATSVSFPGEFCVLTSKDCPKLTGVGVRAKRLLGLKNINVYALGLYVDAPAAKRALHKHKAAAEADQQLFDAVVDAEFEKTLRLVISFGALKRGQFLSALNERLAPLMQKAGASEDLERFKSQFDDVTFRKGLEIAFAGSKDKLVTKIDGQQVGAITSPALVKSLFSIYLGSDPVSTDAKADFGKGLVGLLHE